MISFGLFLITLTIASGSLIRPQLDGKIVGGKDADIKDFPWQLSLRKNGGHICGASIIAPRWALTAAHCVHNLSPKSISFQAGSTSRVSGGTVHTAQYVMEHEMYNSTSFDYDFAVVKINDEFPIGNEGVDIIPLTKTEPAKGSKATVSGWGTLSSGGSSPKTLMQVTVTVTDRAECSNEYDGGITQRMFCAADEGKDSCQGDSGGPLVLNKVQVGVVSWGRGCASPYYAGIYSNIANQYDWIKNIVKF